jgi:hypothetical protein
MVLRLFPASFKVVVLNNGNDQTAIMAFLVSAPLVNIKNSEAIRMGLKADDLPASKHATLTAGLFNGHLSQKAPGDGHLSLSFF